MKLQTLASSDKMEADSTTFEKTSIGDEEYVPFPVTSGNRKLYQQLIINNCDTSIECQIVERLQSFGILPVSVQCTSNNPDCQLVCKTARVIDRVQWVCEMCGKRLPIRYGSFFFRLQCSLLQALQVILAWCEDADLVTTAEWCGVKTRVAALIFDKLDDIAIREHHKTKLGGENSVVMAEMYPDCLNRLSPDTTDQPNMHRILMLADTKHIPTSYKLYVVKSHLKKQHCLVDNQNLREEIEEVISKIMEPGSILVIGDNVPQIDGFATVQQLAQYCDGEMHHFLTRRVWQQAISLCAASRDLCVAGQSSQHVSVQRYLHTSLYRLAYEDGLFNHILRVIASDFTLHSES
ncbi:hypothetical protein ACJJTC_011279 [Scirpophaga incertulas]